MTIVLWHTMMSLDGFIAGPGDDMRWAFEIDSGDDPTLDELVHATGALLVGRRTQDVEDREQPGFYGGDYQGPFFVLTHDPPAEPPVVKGVTGQFVDLDIEEAVALAKETAASRNVGILGATVARHCVEAGLVDEIRIDIAPVLLGDGVRLYDRVGGADVKLWPLSVHGTES